MKLNEPYLPEITLQQILAFRPEDEQTYTSSRLVNAVAKILFTTLTREQDVVAQRLQLDKRRLTYAIELETGLSLKELIVQYRLVQIKQFMEQKPEMTVADIARHTGFSSAHALWRFLQIHTGKTPTGQKSEAMRVDNYHEIEKRVKQQK